MFLRNNSAHVTELEGETPALGILAPQHAKVNEAEAL
jgi:hypothetical protein